MRRSWAFGDVLSHLLDRGGPRTLGPVTQRRDDDRSLPEPCEALLSARGEVSGVRIAATLLARYRALDAAGRLAFFRHLDSALDLDAEAVASLARAYAAAPDVAGFAALARAAEPRRQELLRRLNQPAGATAAIVAMRADLRMAVRARPELARGDHDFVHLLRSWFNRGFLVIREITWDTPARLLDKIVAYEAVHRIDGLEALRHRLDPPDRKCFAFFHPALPEEPLIFVEIALTSAVPGAIPDLLADGRVPLDPAQAKAAIFYSISNCQPGLAGISFGNLLIKNVVAELSAQLPNVETFATLSPIPLLNRWLATQADDPEIGPAARACLDGVADPDTRRSLAARYLLQARRDDGRPFDPVARFHLGNGAEVHDVHGQADPSPEAAAQSGGAMVNYLYDPERADRIHESYAADKAVAASPVVQALARSPIPRRQEPAA